MSTQTNSLPVVRIKNVDYYVQEKEGKIVNVENSNQFRHIHLLSIKDYMRTKAAINREKKGSSCQKLR